MGTKQFLIDLERCGTATELQDFCRRRSLHGTPEIFRNREDDFYEFRKRIASKFSINFHEIYITGSAKLGFSPFKNKLFDFDSDIDVALVSSRLYDKIMDDIMYYQMELRANRRTVSVAELEQYHKFLEYAAIGWMRPDHLPYSFRIRELKNEWFDFFTSISNGRSEVGNYRVSAGAFKSYFHLENYTLSSLRSLKFRTQVGQIDARTD